MHGHRIGYVRVSSFDQNPERQLEHVPVDRLFTDKASGKDTQRPELDRLLAFAREGDTVVVHSMDRLARNLDDLRLIVQKLTKRGVRIEFVKGKSDLHRQRQSSASPPLREFSTNAAPKPSLWTPSNTRLLRPGENLRLLHGRHWTSTFWNAPRSTTKRASSVRLPSIPARSTAQRGVAHPSRRRAQRHSQRGSPVFSWAVRHPCATRAPSVTGRHATPSPSIASGTWAVHVP